MNQFKLKPQVFQAIQFTGGVDNIEAIKTEIGVKGEYLEHKQEVMSEPAEGEEPQPTGKFDITDQQFNVYTVRGWVRLNIGDWLAKDEKGNWDVCSAFLFNQLYEPF